MTTPVTTLAEWKAYRARLRSELLSLQSSPLRPGLRADAWTPRQVFHHVLLVDASAADLLERLLVKAGPLSDRDPQEPWPVRAELMDFPLDTAFSVPAFRGTDPKAEISDKVLRDLEATTMARQTALAERAQQSHLEGVSFPHPLAGRLNFYEWILFGGVHERLHLTQLKWDVDFAQGQTTKRQESV